VRQGQGHKEDADLLELMLQSHGNDADGFTDKEVRDNLFIFFFAGHETTANARMLRLRTLLYRL
jgi:cytochrome P450